MSERKVLNKYYPPDFDPSKIPKCKEPRNKTFCIRLMAPCNMRCTTCGEYIYKGRKFNARKEDVDDMNYLGLRIYRFYIKCTACVSEICFRTDPENTDYVLESGATRNFEALKRAEEQAEKAEKEHQEELENNPMKLLEERTQASKNEMELAESLDELRELNRRTVTVDYDSMLQRYDDFRKDEIAAVEREDEEFVKTIFSKDGVGVKVKRLLDEGSSSSESENEAQKKKKKAKPDKPTDHLTSSVAPKPEKKAVWEKSIGSLGVKKGGLGILVKKKPALNPNNGETFKKPANVSIKPTGNPPTVNSANPQMTAKSGDSVSAANPPKPATGSAVAPQTNGGLGGLGLLGNYSDSESGSE